MSEVAESLQDAELEAIMAELEAQSAAYAADEDRAESPVPPPEEFEHDYEVAATGEVEVESKTSESEPVAAEPVSSPKEEAVEAVARNAVDEGAEYVEREEKAKRQAEAEAVSRLKAEADRNREAYVSLEGRNITVDTNSKPAKNPHAGLKYFIDVKEFNRETAVQEHDLDRCMIEQSSLRAFYGAQAAYAEGQYSSAKVRFDVLEAALYDHHRKEFAADGTLKVTEKMVESAVKADPRWLKGKNTVIEAETIANVNKALSISLGDRKDMLVQLGADRREEGKGAMRMLESKATEAGKRAFT